MSEQLNIRDMSLPPNTALASFITDPWAPELRYWRIEQSDPLVRASLTLGFDVDPFTTFTADGVTEDMCSVEMNFTSDNPRLEEITVRTSTLFLGAEATKQLIAAPEDEVQCMLKLDPSLHRNRRTMARLAILKDLEWREERDMPKGQKLPDLKSKLFSLEAGILWSKMDLMGPAARELIGSVDLIHDARIEELLKGNEQWRERFAEIAPIIVEQLDEEPSLDEELTLVNLIAYQADKRQSDSIQTARTKWQALIPKNYERTK